MTLSEKKRNRRFLELFQSDHDGMRDRDGADEVALPENRADDTSILQEQDTAAADATGAADRQDTSSTEYESLLVRQARQDPKAFGALYELYVDKIYAYIYHRVGNAQDAEDLTARTFYRALDRLETYEDRGLPFGAWLFRIAHNLVANWHRDRSKRRFLSLDRLWMHSQESDTPERKVEQDEKHAALWSAIERLPEDRRNLLLFKFGAHLSNLEIGDMMGKSESAIKSLYFRTLGALRRELEVREWGATGSSTDMALQEVDSDAKEEERFE